MGIPGIIEILKSDLTTTKFYPNHTVFRLRSGKREKNKQTNNTKVMADEALSSILSEVNM